MNQQTSDNPNGNYQLELFWDATYAIVVSLLETYPDINPADMGLEAMADLIVALPGFTDEPTIVTTQMLMDIQAAWYEEHHP